MRAALTSHWIKILFRRKHFIYLRGQHICYKEENNNYILKKQSIKGIHTENDECHGNINTQRLKHFKYAHETFKHSKHNGTFNTQRKYSLRGENIYYTDKTCNMWRKHLLHGENILYMCITLHMIRSKSLIHRWWIKIRIVSGTLGKYTEGPGGGGGGLPMSTIVPMCRSEGSLCKAKLPRQGSVFRRFSLDMGNKFRKSSILSCDNSFNGLICGSLI